MSCMILTALFIIPILDRLLVSNDEYETKWNEFKKVIKEHKGI